MATIKDVARIANVSVTTVSATLSGSAPVSETLQKRVWDAVRAANYQPDPVAQNLRRGVSTTIGLIVPDIATPWSAHLARAMQKALSQRGFNMLFASNEDDPDREMNEIALMTAHRVAGLIIAPTSLGDKYAERLVAAVTTPAVLVDRVVAPDVFDAVADDNELGAQLLTHYLLRLGHRDIAFLSGRRGISASDERFDAFRAAMAGQGVPVREDLMCRSIFRHEHAYAEVQTLMTNAAPPTAIMCISIAQLLGTMAGLKNMGLRVPEDVSVISFDDFHPAVGWQPSITALTQDTQELSAQAAALLLARLGRGANEPVQPPQIVRIKPRLCVRESCRSLLQG
ncbi:LacI family DNA-binding transcriptional regulator [Roseicitreum antarcticum]|uniref:Transcriptional regulator, LacI family n=1 Tax=Roseicitreum antarcticum TaxID=564137 RepID=A0A1H3AT62_9RHOB|nr:LacI family DNA-binding transcriptional regulator [Roseicitreum antarcticum]SDX32930.1 transcriptional regulator, LacI family [Roseicitreum antarcticum]